MRISVIVALAIALVVGLWVASGLLDPEATRPQAQKTPAPVTHLDAAPAVRVLLQEAEPHQRTIELRGVTEARRAVNLKSETHGIVKEILVSENTLVHQGEELVRLDVAERDAEVRQARALLRQRRIEFDAAEKLATKGYRSETERAASAASLEAAEAAVEAAEIELSHTVLKAPFGGIVERHLMEEGDFADRASALIRLVELSPLRVVAYASESEILPLHLGQAGIARLTDDRTVPGRIAYLAQEAEAATRTFRVELEISNRDFSIPAGVTADVVVTLPPSPAHKVSPALLTLNKQGQLGIKVVDQDERARFVPVQVVDDEIDGVWLSGLPTRAQIITVGQEFVDDGQAVRPIPVNPSAASGDAEEPST